MKHKSCICIGSTAFEVCPNKNKTMVEVLMVIQQRAKGYVLNIHLVEIEGHNKCLQDIVDEIYFYLFSFEDNWLYLTVGKDYFDRCCQSWEKVSACLERFMFDQKMNYAALAVVLGQEREKFSRHSFYGKRLRMLESLIVSGPMFTICSHSD